jgi:hypothetical protein
VQTHAFFPRICTSCTSLYYKKNNWYMFKQPEVQTFTLVAYTPLYTNQSTSTEPALADYSLYGLPYIYCGHFSQSISNNIDALQGLVLQHYSPYPFGSNTGLMPDSLRSTPLGPDLQIVGSHP